MNEAQMIPLIRAQVSLDATMQLAWALVGVTVFIATVYVAVRWWEFIEEEGWPLIILVVALGVGMILSSGCFAYYRSYRFNPDAAVRQRIIQMHITKDQAEKLALD